MRITYRPSLDGSPANTAICAPFGNAGGAGPHFNWSAETATWSSAAFAGIDAKPATNNVVIKARRNMLILPIASLCPLKLPHRDAKKNKRRIYFRPQREHFCGIQDRQLIDGDRTYRGHYGTDANECECCRQGDRIGCANVRY